MDLVCVVAVQQEIDQMKSVGTDKAALTDLKVYLKNINASMPESLSLVILTEHLSDIYGNVFNAVLPSSYHAMDALVKLKLSDREPYLTMLDAQVVRGRARQSSYHVADCFDLLCARRPIRHHTLAKGPMPYIVLNTPASTEFCQEGIDSLQKARGDEHDGLKEVPGRGDDLDVEKDVISTFEAYMMTRTVRAIWIQIHRYLQDMVDCAVYQ
ncbi:hypothetical protein ARMGADRAFT_1039886 [Armillaria gallica]|uniref:Uncharacterized protein n=1 Tax=Armillaria gallica TaxID=47427 RepID=A0A2H3CFG2_ARMGA|nr:hypothetical protein ARMGADRAFT_1039886 [Armillaria gallica]